MSAKCLRCGAGSEWIQGRVRPEPAREFAAAEQREMRLLGALREIVGIAALPVDHERPLEHSCCAVAQKIVEIGSRALSGA